MSWARAGSSFVAARVPSPPTCTRFSGTPARRATPELRQKSLRMFGQCGCMLACRAHQRQSRQRQSQRLCPAARVQASARRHPPISSRPHTSPSDRAKCRVCRLFGRTRRSSAGRRIASGFDILCAAPMQFPMRELRSAVRWVVFVWRRHMPVLLRSMPKLGHTLLVGNAVAATNSLRVTQGPSAGLALRQRSLRHTRNDPIGGSSWRLSTEQRKAGEWRTLRGKSLLGPWAANLAKDLAIEARWLC